jgi:hypothetical protein
MSGNINKMKKSAPETLEDKLHHILRATLGSGKVIPSWDHRGPDTRATSASQISIE